MKEIFEDGDYKLFKNILKHTVGDYQQYKLYLAGKVETKTLKQSSNIVLTGENAKDLLFDCPHWLDDMLGYIGVNILPEDFRKIIIKKTDNLLKLYK